jgi:serine protease inhibitor
VDFKKNAEGARATINKWVEGKTKDKIKDLNRPRRFDRSNKIGFNQCDLF